ncbi:hypothetical protein BDR26DRAFT_866017 [Obelidium mucronatum]|nr:hypothetical protein BDR26DRAFT_866017 [Obelidium mucronatum]
MTQLRPLPSLQSLRSVRQSQPGTPFARIKKATDTATGRVAFTLGVLDSIVVYRSIAAIATILLVIQLVFTVTSVEGNPLESPDAFSQFLASNANTLWTVALCVFGFGYFKLSHLYLLYGERNVCHRGRTAGASGLDEVRHKWFSTWADGEPDYSDLTIELRSIERALGLSLASQVNSRHELFSATELNTQNSPTQYSFPKHSQLFQMNVLRMPLATSLALNERLVHPKGDPPIVDSMAQEPVWCVGDAGGTMIATRERDLGTNEMRRRRSRILGRKHAVANTAGTLPTTMSFQEKLQASVIGVSAQGVEIISASDFTMDELKSLGI